MSMSCAAARQEFPGTQFFFQPADIVSQILNFGAPAPIDIQLIGPRKKRDYMRSRSKSPTASRQIPGAVDVHVQQLFSAPPCSQRGSHPRPVRRTEQNDVAKACS
jgi:hypothetical protein